MSMIPVGVIGASGYAGGELVRLIDSHPGLELRVISGHTTAGMALASVHPHLPGGERLLASQEEALDSDVELMFLALPHGASAQPAMELLDGGVKVADLGADFRLSDPVIYEEAYGGPHPFPEQLGNWAYGLPELDRNHISGADRVAVPGCYPTSAVLAIAPLAAAGLIDTAAIVVDSMSGVSGAGAERQGSPDVWGDRRGRQAYAVGTHRHRPEMEQAISREQRNDGDRLVHSSPRADATRLVVDVLRPGGRRRHG